MQKYAWLGRVSVMGSLLLLSTLISGFWLQELERISSFELSNYGCIWKDFWTWCSGRTWRERVGREAGGGIGMGKTCEPKAFSCQCMTKFTTKKKKKKKPNKNVLFCIAVEPINIAVSFRRTAKGLNHAYMQWYVAAWMGGEFGVEWGVFLIKEMIEKFSGECLDVH